ncbi:alcohol dehydrogenase catalytic domain-containing protein [Saccharopolyspora sp. NPDC047091]|uniref:alcohol dehydrogenase catalytic domain-containing protein n=1 Tax=Saccharopolyspora sp. NPDC047091 TaxID=3155924 RepID=UPI0033EBB656
MTRMHRAVVRDGTGIAVRHRPTRPPGPGELLLGTEVAGLCGTDVQMLRGMRDDPAEVIGHEGIATVVAAGPGVAPELAAGTKVVVNPTHPTDPAFLLGHNVGGLLQERTWIPASAVDAGLVLPLTAVPEPDLAALLEPLAVVRYALSALRRFRPRTLVVFGAGTVGRLAVRAASRWLAEAERRVLVRRTADELPPEPVHAVLEPGADLAAEMAPGPVAVLIATPRDATVGCLETAIAAAAGHELAVDLVGGLPPAADTPMLPGADLVALRAANRAGTPDPPEHAGLSTTTGDRVHLFGHRGVGNDHLRIAADELVRAPERYRDLVTHGTDLHGAARIMRELATGRGRDIDGRRLVKLAVRISAPRPRHHEEN